MTYVCYFSEVIGAYDEIVMNALTVDRAPENTQAQQDCFGLQAQSRLTVNMLILIKK